MIKKRDHVFAWKDSTLMMVAMIDWTERRQRTWGQLGLDAPPGLPALLARYREPQRHYHTLQHLEECFAAFALLRGQAMRPGEIELALWFHDAVYDPARRDNEALSAGLAADCLRSASADAAVIDRVVSMILATRHHEAGDDGDCAILLDVDLAILGAAPARFAEYERQIRAEYAHVPDDAYRVGRGQVLAGFLARPRLYLTDLFFERNERQARHNLGAQPSDKRGTAP
jgi:predicted metal-dependent HD superfamily phosphohydrolase